MRGAMYADVWVPNEIRQPNPIVFFHGNGQTGVDWQQTPDGRQGWAYRLMEQGYVLYMVDYPARGRSAYVPVPGPDGKPVDGAIGIRTALELERIWTNARERGDFPLKMNHTQWPGAGKIGDPIFDSFIKTQVQFAAASTDLARDAAVALLEMIGTPAILLTHSQGGGIGFDVTEARPQLVKAIVTVEPGGPQIGNAGERVRRRQRGHRQGPGGTEESSFVGPHHEPLRIRSTCESAVGSECVSRGQVGASGRNPLLAAGRAGPKAGAMEEYSGALDFRRRHVSPGIRSVYSEVAEPGGRQGRLRAPGKCGHHREQPHDDARKEQRRRHQVHRELDPETRSHVMAIMPPVFHRAEELAMKRLVHASVLTVAFVSLSALLLAHHGDSGRYEEKLTTVKGTIVELQLINPHSTVVLDVTEESSGGGGKRARPCS